MEYKQLHRNKMTGKYHLGFKGFNKENIEYEIVEYRHNKDLIIRFLNDGTETKTTGAYLTLGFPLRPLSKILKVEPFITNFYI